nr:hypothetical protein [Lachnospiraceae bacterium]
MKILILEDSNEKYMALVRVLKRCGEENVSWVDNQADGLALLQEAAQSGEPYDLAITDMHYPPAPDAPSEFDCGKRLPAALAEKELHVKTVLCSSVRYQVPGFDACLWFVKSSDWESELRDILQRLR